MFKKAAIGIVIVFGIFLAYVASKNGEFRYERSGIIMAPAEKIYPYISDLKLGQQWSPFEKGIEMKKSFSADGRSMEFDSKDSGSGRIEILKQVLNESVDLKLTMLKPFHAENLVEYRLTPQSKGTKFTWTMSGNGGLMSKLMTSIIDCEKMVGGQFEKGIGTLKHVVESQTVK